LLDALIWLEASPLGQAVRGAGVWSYAIINLAHIAGVATLFGCVVVLDLRLMGLFPRASLAMVAMPTVPLAAAGFAVAATSGICLLATNATEYSDNPFLLIKFSAIFVALLNIGVMHRLSAWHARAAEPRSSTHRRHLALSGGVSLAAWSTALAAGRMLGYW
jgi:hypothetical protein